MDEPVSPGVGDQLMDLVVRGASSRRGRIIEIFSGLVLWHVIGLVGLFVVGLVVFLVKSWIAYLGLFIIFASWYLLWLLFSDRRSRWIAWGWIGGYILQLVILVVGLVKLYNTPGLLSGMDSGGVVALGLIAILVGILGFLGVPVLSLAFLFWMFGRVCEISGELCS